jgi:hypothetical protein
MEFPFAATILDALLGAAIRKASLPKPASKVNEVLASAAAALGQPLKNYPSKRVRLRISCEWHR